MRNDSFSPLIETFAADEGLEEALREIGRLRVIAWRNEGEMPVAASGCGEVWTDEHDFHAHHWTAKVGGTLVAAARLCLHGRDDAIPDRPFLGKFFDEIPFPAAFVNRLVVCLSARGLGLSGKLDAARIEFAIRYGAEAAVANTWNPLRVKQLQSSGWKMLGEFPERFVARAPNYVFVKNLRP